MAKKSGLGRGLDILLSSSSIAMDDSHSKDKNKEGITDGTLKYLAVEVIIKGEYQPRLKIEPEALQELADSIKAQGLIQPVVVRKVKSGKFELIAGERRWRAAQMAGLHEIPAVIRNIPDQAAAAMSLIENIQREDLNPLEEATAMNRLIDEFGLTHQQTAESVGRSRSAVTNILRLLELEGDTKLLLDSGLIEMGHARALLGLKGEAQTELAKKVAKRQLTVRDAERMVKLLNNPPNRIKSSKPLKAIEVTKLETSLSEALGAMVDIHYNNKGKGKLTISYNSLDELDGVLEHFNVEI